MSDDNITRSRALVRRLLCPDKDSVALAHLENSFDLCMQNRKRLLEKEMARNTAKRMREPSEAATAAEDE
eukprot:4013520-Prymnesium_polylepis.1